MVEGWGMIAAYGESSMVRGGNEGSPEGTVAERWRGGWTWRWRGIKRVAAKWSMAKEGEKTAEGRAIEDGGRRVVKGSHRGTAEEVEE